MAIDALFYLSFRSKVAGLAALLCSVASVTLGVARANPLEGMGSLQVGVHGGTLGLGVNAGLDISEKFAARGMFNTFGLDYEETESGNEYKGDLDLQSIGLVTDWHPFAGGFQVGHRPPHHPAAEHIEYDGQIQESRRGRDVGDVGHPQPVRASASKRRSTKSGAGRAWGSRRVVRGPLRRLTPAKPASRITRATRLRLTGTPSATSSA